jgi:hypothetical protein
VIDVPATFEITVGAPPSIAISTLFVPLTDERPIVAEVPVNVNAIPVPGQLSSLVAGFHPKYRKVLESPVEAGFEADVEVAIVVGALPS